MTQTPLPEASDYDFIEEQNAPGAYYQSTTPQLPDYFYTQRYFDETDGDGARPIADYAPPGYMHRDYQSAPGEPEYTRLTPPARISDEDRDQLVVR